MNAVFLNLKATVEDKITEDRRAKYFTN